MWKRRLFGGRSAWLVLAAVPLVIAGYWSAPASAGPTGTFTYGISAPIENYDPANFGNANYSMLRQLYDSLIEYDAKGVPQPKLATQWSFNNDHSAITLKLRTDVKYASGRRLTADDVMFTIKRMQDEAVGANLIKSAQNITSMAKVDDHTVTLAFNPPNSGIFDFLNNVFVIHQATEADIRQKPDGTGPFMLQSQTPGVGDTFVRNPNYWNPDQPKVKTIRRLEFTDTNSRVQALKAGQLDAIDIAPFTQYDSLINSGEFQSITVPLGAFGGYGIVFNTTKKPFDDPKVRQAIGYALNRATITHLLYGSHSGPMCLPWPEYSIAYDQAQNTSCSYDLDKAKSLLAEAGQTNLNLTILVSPEGQPGSDKVGQVLQQDLAKIGVDAKIQSDSEASSYDDMKAGKYDLSPFQYMKSNLDPSALFGSTIWFRPGSAMSHYDSPEYNSLIQAGLTEADPAARKVDYRKLNQFLIDQAFILPFTLVPASPVVSKKITGFDFGTDGYALLANVAVGP